MIIRDERLKRALLRALADKYASKIMSSTAQDSASVMDLVKREGIPPTSAYRRVAELKEAGLLAVERTVVTRDGKKYDLYKSVFREVTIAFRRGKLEVSAVPNMDVVERAFSLFHSFEDHAEEEEA